MIGQIQPAHTGDESGSRNRRRQSGQPGAEGRAPVSAGNQAAAQAKTADLRRDAKDQAQGQTEQKMHGLRVERQVVEFEQHDEMVPDGLASRPRSQVGPKGRAL